MNKLISKNQDQNLYNLKIDMITIIFITYLKKTEL